MHIADHWMFGGHMWLFWLFIIVFVFVVLKMIIQQNRSKKNGNENESSLEILKKRYAKGEIDKEEFEQKKKDLLS